LVFVDTNALISEQALDSTNALAAFDSLRVDLLGADGSITDYLDAVVPGLEQWPISFGVAAEGLTQDSMLLRIRLFSGALATRGTNAGRTTLEPEPSASIDRVIGVDFPLSGVRKVGVLMDADCIGRPASFSPTITSCASRSKTARAPEQAFVDLETTEWTHSKAGTWALLKPSPCVGQGPSDSVCLAGGFTLLGDPDLALPPSDLIGSAFPLRPVRLAPFWMDRSEFTVGRLQQLLAKSTATAPLDDVAVAQLTIYDDCTWRDGSDSARDALPLSCISPLNAEAVCRAVGGHLPTEAQWEYAARGHGSGRLFPWGNELPACCQSWLSRLAGSDIQELGSCPGYGPSATDTSGQGDCTGRDVSIDGVVDLGGNLTEATRDAWSEWSQDSECWPELGILQDPTCQRDDGLRVGRGGNWSLDTSLARSSLRHKIPRGGALTTLGFRCVYEDVVPEDAQ
jgi:formylglycine-generating enzyme required for sulfatase activity